MHAHRYHACCVTPCRLASESSAAATREWPVCVGKECSLCLQPPVATYARPIAGTCSHCHRGCRAGARVVPPALQTCSQRVRSPCVPRVAIRAAFEAPTQRDPLEDRGRPRWWQGAWGSREREVLTPAGGACIAGRQFEPDDGRARAGRQVARRLRLRAAGGHHLDHRYAEMRRRRACACSGTAT